MRANMRAGLKPAPTDGFPNKYVLCTMDFPMDGLPQQLRIMHYAQWISQWMDHPNNYELRIMHNGFPNGWIPPTITNYALCTMDFPNGWIPPTITNYAL